MLTDLFLDTNVLLYTHDDKDLKKQEIALDKIRNSNFVTSTHVLTEYANVCIRKFKFSKIEVTDAIANLILLEKVIPTTPSDFLKAALLIKRYDFSFFDALIVATALNHGCNTLYTEDLQHNQVIENKLTVVNPFI